MRSEGMHLRDGDRVCIVGGGPSGSFAAIHLLRLAHRLNREFEVLVFEPKDFSQPGPGGCNRCAGILSTRLLRGLEALKLSLPEDVIQAEIHAYAVHLNEDILRIERPDPTRHILSVYRGGGPRLLRAGSLSSFDGFLLEQATQLGAKLIPQRVRKIRHEDRPVIETRQDEYPADLMVLATGVNTRTPLSQAFNYHPPKTMVMAQDELHRPPNFPSDQVSAFFKPPPDLIFGALTPKDDFLNISLLGKHMTVDAVSNFLEEQSFSPSLKAMPVSLCGCTPRIAVSPARNYMGPRWVAVGDAAVTRLYKDGIGSAFHTSLEAMRTALHYGIHQRAFREHYLPYCRKIAFDNICGKLLFRIWQATLRRPKVLDAWKSTIRNESHEDISQRVHIRILWGMFTGDEPYQKLLRLAISPSAIASLIRAMREQTG